MPEPDSWRHMASAPKDGSRILVTIRPSEQGAQKLISYIGRMAISSVQMAGAPLIPRPAASSNTPSRN